MAKAVLFLLSEVAPLATGHPLVVNGVASLKQTRSENREQSPSQRAIPSQNSKIGRIKS
jgi:hypothetical protein